jgi:single-strand DNA-binding protein
MAQGDVTLTVIGTLTGDPELRFTPAGHAVANFTIATNPRKYDRDSQEWKDGEASFWRVNVWRQQAENVAESLTKGARVSVTGVIAQRNYEVDGQRRTSFEITADDVCPSLKWATAKITKASRAGGQVDDPAHDPWSTPAGAAAGGGPPF